MTALLDVEEIATFYGPSQALFGLSLSVGPREVVTLLGRNGMGKSTTVKSVMGIVSPARGRVRFAGADLSGAAAWRIAQAGIGLVPEGRHVFPNLTVRENLVATARNRLNAPEPWTIERVYRMFPRLRERERNLAANLSGGEQQMLAIGRALMTNPRLLILDEATEGLAPMVRADIWTCLETLRADGLAMIVIDKNVAPLMRLADRHYVVEKGRVVWCGTTSELQARPDVLQAHVGV